VTLIYVSVCSFFLVRRGTGAHWHSLRRAGRFVPSRFRVEQAQGPPVLTVRLSSFESTTADGSLSCLQAHRRNLRKSRSGRPLPRLSRRAPPLHCAHTTCPSHLDDTWVHSSFPRSTWDRQMVGSSHIDSRLAAKMPLVCSKSAFLCNHVLRYSHPQNRRKRSETPAVPPSPPPTEPAQSPPPPPPGPSMKTSRRRSTRQRGPRRRCRRRWWG
jgi:hypothetical protein